MYIFVHSYRHNAVDTCSSKSKCKQSPAYISLVGQPLVKENPLDNQGNIQKVNTPLLRLVWSKSKFVKGTVLLIPGGGYQTIRFTNQGKKIAMLLSADGFDIAILDYHINDGTQTRTWP